VKDFKNTLAVAVLFVGLIAFGGSSQEIQAQDKSGYWLLKPVPAEMMRELTPDRPDKTESPYTLDAGHFMVEMDFANYTFDKSGSTTTRAWNIAPINFKVGLFGNTDIQFVSDDYEHVALSDHATGRTTVVSGMGDFLMRVKLNMWGDDHGRTAFAFLPYVKFPTNTNNLGNHAVEGGVICPLALKLPADVDAGFETAVSLLRDETGNRYHEDFINSVTLDHAIVGKLSGYLEFFSEISTEHHTGWQGTIDAGFEFLVSENVQLDCGCNFGITPAADDFNPFAGITVRF
jgi:Putative MetA-pathway of phenol degradation